MAAKMADNEAVASRLRQLRRDRGWTEEEYAAAEKVSLRTAQRHLKGKTPPDANGLNNLVEATGVSGHWLLTGEGPMYPKSPDAERQGWEMIVKVVEAVEAQRRGERPLTPDEARARQERHARALLPPGGDATHGERGASSG